MLRRAAKSGAGIGRLRAQRKQLLNASTACVAAGFGVELPFLQYLPLDSVKLSWILPAVLGGVIGALIPMRRAKCSLAAQKA